jgi:hypothetical protein
MEKGLRAIVIKTEVMDRWSPGDILAKVAEKSLVEDIKKYRKGGLIYPDGKGGVKPFSKEATKHSCAPRIYAGVMRLARHGLTDNAIKYAMIFDKEFTLEHAHINQVYLENGTFVKIVKHNKT